MAPRALPQQAAGGDRAPGQGPPLRRAPVAHRHQRHQLQLHPPGPALSQLGQGLPAGNPARPVAVDVAPDRPQAVAPGPLQGPLRPLQHGGAIPRGRLLLIGPQGSPQGPLPADVRRRAVGLVEVGVGLHQRGECQGHRAGGLGGAAGIDPHQPPRLLAQPHRHQPIDVGGRKGNGGIKQAARQAQGRQPALHSLPPARGGFTHRRISGPWAASLWRITKCPATPRVVAL